ncbi:translation initiation factor IF-2-like [Astyanax mexicanus]|uniref:translation initiation factor IF-2-like n=1 Tax=Astyanax mexicanus TaxID=7994 RepID=UPI0020CB3AB9|nr:translation initiation factor IF-2-like [Astyanax mexicanus]
MNMDPETPADALSAGGALSVPESSRNVAAEGGGAEVRDAEGETPAAKAVRQVHPALQAGAPAAEAVRQVDPALQAGAPAAEAVRQVDPALLAGAPAAEAVRQADPALQAGAPAAVRQADPALQAGAPAAEDAQRMPDGSGNVLPGLREAEGESAVGGGSTEVKTDPPPGADASAAQDAKSTAAVGKANTRPNESKNRRNKGAGCVTNAHPKLQNNPQSKR